MKQKTLSGLIDELKTKQTWVKSTFIKALDAWAQATEGISDGELNIAMFASLEGSGYFEDKTHYFLKPGDGDLYKILSFQVEEEQFRNADIVDIDTMNMETLRRLIQELPKFLTKYEEKVIGVIAEYDGDVKSILKH